MFAKNILRKKKNNKQINEKKKKIRRRKIKDTKERKLFGRFISRDFLGDITILFYVKEVFVVHYTSFDRSKLSILSDTTRFYCYHLGKKEIEIKKIQESFGNREKIFSFESLIVSNLRPTKMIPFSFYCCLLFISRHYF